MLVKALAHTSLWGSQQHLVYAKRDIEVLVHAAVVEFYFEGRLAIVTDRTDIAGFDGLSIHR
jgi:hypothetical protein